MQLFHVLSSGYLGFVELAVKGPDDPGIQAHTLFCSRHRDALVQIGPQPDIQFARERPAWLDAVLGAGLEIQIDGPLELASDARYVRRFKCRDRIGSAVDDPPGMPSSSAMNHPAGETGVLAHLVVEASVRCYDRVVLVNCQREVEAVVDGVGRCCAVAAVVVRSRAPRTERCPVEL